MGCCLSVLRKQSLTSSTPTHDPQGPVDSGTSPVHAGQEQTSGTAAAGNQPQHVPAPLVSTDESEGEGIPKDDTQGLAISEISDLSPDCAVQEQGKEGSSGACDQLPHGSSSSGPTDKNEGIDMDIVQYSVQLPTISVPYPGCVGQAQGAEEVPGTNEQLYHASLSSTEKNEEIVITSIRASDVALGLRRLPAGFYVALYHNGLEWRTDNKPSSVNNDVVEWGGPIPISSDSLAVIRLEVYASFEFQPMLGTGDQLRRLTTTVGQLLDRSAKDTPFTFFPEDGDVVSPCSSILVTVKRRKCENCNSSGSRVVGPHWLTTEPRGELEDATNQGHNALTRYRKHGEKQDLERSIQQFERAHNICSWDDPRRAAAKSNLAIAKSILSQVEGTDAPLEDALWMHRDALAARPAGHPDRPLTLIQLALVHSVRFGRGRHHVDEANGENAEEFLREAIELSTTESYEKRAGIVMLELCAARKGSCVKLDSPSSTERNSILNLTDEDPQRLSVWLLERFERFGDLVGLQRAITILEGLVKSLSIWSRNYHVALENLGIALSYRFQHLGRLSDLEDAISALRETVYLTPDGHPDKPGRLNSLGNSLQIRFERLGQLGDLEDAISARREAVDFTPDCHPRKPGYLNNLGLSFQTRFKRLGQLSDLEDAISIQRAAVHLTLDGHPHKPVLLNNLGNSLHTRFLRLGQLSDLEDAISTQKAAVHLTPDGHPDKPRHLNNMGDSFETRFERLGQLSDLEDAILRKREAAYLTPDDHPRKPGYLDSLGNALQNCFERLGQISDLEDAILRKREAIHLTPDGHPDKSAYLNNLGLSLQTRFERLEQLSDLEDAISTQRAAIHLTPDGHPHKPALLNNLGNSLRIHFSHLGQLHDLEDAISTQREAVHLTPDGHPDKPARLNNLGTSFQTRFERLGQLGDLEDAISRKREAVHLTLDGHSDKPVLLNNLGLSLQTCFLHLGQLSDLEDAISTQRAAVHLTPDGHPDKPGRLNSLGNSFQTRFLRLGQLGDLEDAISAQREAVDLAPGGHPDKPAYLNSLGTSVEIRFECLGQPSDLEDAISTQRVAVHLTPDGHPHKPTRLNNLGLSLRTRFGRLGQLSDLEDTISAQREAIHLTPDGHPDKPSLLNNLGLSFQTRFERLGRLSDLEDAISTQKESIHLTPHDHPHKPACLINLANSFSARFLRLRQVTDLEHAISLSSHAASIPIGPINVRLSAARHWIRYARFIRHPSLLHAYSVAVRLVPRLAWIGLPLSHRYNELTQGASVIREAAAAALDAGFPETALEWLEQGRSVVWGELFQLRSSYEELSFAHPNHAGRLHALSTELDQASAAHEQSLSALSEQNQSGAHYTAGSLQRAANKHRALAIERDKLLQEIRRLPGFERFLLRKPFSQLRAAAHSGPVVVLNAVETRCDALIVVAGVDHVIHVPLPNFTSERCANLQVILKNFVRDTRAAKLGRWEGISWDHILSPLWKCIVKPVLDALAFSVARELSRIFWCPTGPLAFLPIHAAGFYNEQYSEPGHKIFDFVVSSYVPSLATLVPSRSIAAVPSGNLRLLAVRQPDSDGQAPLPGVITEMAYIKDVIEKSPAQTSLVESSVGTVEEVLQLMKESDWVHFACHGVQKGVNSGLCLADRRSLTLRDIVAVSRPRGGLAFLSACQTAMGEKKLSDEAIHIAAGMLFAGYEGVIGTMWSISDKLAPRVARDVYTELLREGTRPDYREAARALQEVIGCLRNHEVPFEEWIPFIHIGL